MKIPDPTNNLRVSLKHLALASVLSASFLAGTAQAGTPITWNVAGNGVWDTTTTNWTLDGSTLTTFASDGSEDAIFTAATGGTITISSAMSPASTTVSGGNYTFSGGPLAGTGSLTKSGSGTLKFDDLVPGSQTVVQNTYSGGTIMNGGTLHLGGMYAGISPACQGALGTGPVTLNAGTIEFDRYTATNDLTVNGGTLYSPNGWGATWSGAITLNATLTCNEGYNLTLSGAISGTGGLNKTGGSALVLSGTNSYTGKTVVNSGTLQHNVPLSNAGTNGALGAPSGDNAVIDLYPGTTFLYGGGQLSPVSPPRSSTDRTINLAGTGSGTVTLNGNNLNDMGFQFGGFSATGTGTRTLLINCKGDRPVYTYTGGIPDMSDTGKVSLTCTWSSGSSSSNGLINVQGINTFTGPITLNGGGNGGPGTLLIGGSASNYNTVTPGGSGVLGSGNYAGNITFTANPASVILYYAGSVDQTLSGVISGPGAVTVGGMGIVTLSGANTYSGNTTINAGSKLQLTQKAALSTATSVYLSTTGAGSDLQLNFAAPDMVQVAQLFVDGTQKPVGLYKAVGSSQSGTELAQITGTGRLLVGIPVIADFTAAPGITGDAPFAVTFTDNSQSILGTVNSWSWSFGDVTTSTTRGPHSVTYPLWGIYTVTLTVTDTAGFTNSTTKTITVAQPLNLVVSSEGQFENAIVNVDSTNTVTFGTGLGGNPDFGGLTGKGSFALKDSSSAPVTLEVGSNTLANSKFGGVLTDAGGLTKVGTNTLTLSGQNTYLGDTVLSAGILQLANTAIAAGLDTRAWKNYDGQIDGSPVFNMPGSPTDSTFGGTIGYATESVNMNGAGPREHFGTGTLSGVPDSSSLRPTGYSQHYTIEYRGKLYIPADGTYRFATISDDGSALWIDPGDVSTANPSYGTAAVQNNYYQGMTQRSSSQLSLTAGYHDFIVRFYQGGGGNGLDVQWDPAGGTNFVAIPGANFFHVTTGGGGGGGHDILPTTTSVKISSAAILDIENPSNTVTTLYLGGIGQAAGTWGSSTSAATNKNDTFFSGTGVLTVTSAGTGSYASWAAAQTPPLAGGPGAVGHDGIPNLLVYALNIRTNGTNGSPGTLAGKLLSFAKRSDAVSNGDISYAIETSPNLQNPWTTVTPDVNNGSTISYTLPSGQGKIFARLKVKQN